MKPVVRIGLTNPKSPSNVGSVMRAAGCFSADSVYYTGTRFERAAKFHTDTKDLVSKIPLKSVDSLLGLNDCDAEAEIVCIELVEGATALPDFEHPDNAYYIFGPEDGSLSQDVVNRADHVVYIPTVGCLNLAATVNIVLYDRKAKEKLTPDQGDQLIISSRDRNNLLAVKN